MARTKLTTAQTVSSVLGYAEVSANQGSITTITDITSLTVTVTVPTLTGNQRLEVECFIHLFSTVATDFYRVHIREGSTDLNLTEGPFIQASGQQWAMCKWSNAAVTPGSHTYKISLERASGTGTLSTFQSATRLGFIQAKVV